MMLRRRVVGDRHAPPGQGSFEALPLPGTFA